MDDVVFQSFKASFKMTEAQYAYYKELMETSIEDWPEPGKTELWGKRGTFARLGMSLDFVRETIAQYAIEHAPLNPPAPP